MKLSRRIYFAPIALMALFSITGFCCAEAYAANGTVSGTFRAEPPTLTALGFDWRISGDDNRNAGVEVSYRRKGEGQWHKALPLFRLQHERIGDPVGPGYPKPPVSDGTGYVNPFHYNVPNMFSGEYSRETGQDRHSILVDYDVFVNVKLPDKSDPQRLYSPADFDFSLRPGSKAVDAGMPLPTINDDYTGRMPDLGAYELGRPLPHYGPR